VLCFWWLIGALNVMHARKTLVPIDIFPGFQHLDHGGWKILLSVGGTS
jgi:hypothetical protein